LHKFPFVAKNVEELKIPLKEYIDNTETLNKDEFNSKLLSDAAKDFIMTVLQPYPANRGHALSAIRHPWFKNHEKEILEEVMKSKPTAKDEKSEDEE